MTRSGKTRSEYIRQEFQIRLFQTSRFPSSSRIPPRAEQRENSRTPHCTRVRTRDGRRRPASMEPERCALATGRTTLEIDSGTRFRCARTTIPTRLELAKRPVGNSPLHTPPTHPERNEFSNFSFGTTFADNPHPGIRAPATFIFESAFSCRREGTRANLFANTSRARGEPTMGIVDAGRRSEHRTETICPRETFPTSSRNFPRSSIHDSSRDLPNLEYLRVRIGRFSNVSNDVVSLQWEPFGKF